MKIKWIFFDVGGVLTDESRFTNWIQEGIFNIVKKYDPSITLEKVRESRPTVSAIQGNLNKNMLNFFLKDDQKEEAMKEYKEMRAKGKSHAEQQVIRLEALEVVKILSQKYNLGLIANQHVEMKEKLERAGILEYFKLKDVSEDYGVEKPDPKFFEAVLKDARVEPKDAVLVDDNLERSIIPGKKLGMTTVWYKLEDRESPQGVVDYTIISLEELLKIF